MTNASMEALLQAFLCLVRNVYGVFFLRNTLLEDISSSRFLESNIVEKLSVRRLENPYG